MPLLIIQQIYLFKMRFPILISFFIYTSIAFVILQSDLNQYVTSLNPPQPTVQNTYNYNTIIPLAPNAKWIWAPNWNNQNCPNPINITEIFTVTCRNPITLHAASSYSFTIYINGKKVFSGKGLKRISSIVISEKYLNGCSQINTLVIQASHDGVCLSTNPAGVIYALTQNTNQCYSCKNRQHYNTTTCQCQCNNNDTCNSPKIWSGMTNHPTCSCICPNRTSCPISSYYDYNTCSCLCIPKVCNNLYRLNETTCQCQKIPCYERMTCPKYYKINKQTCQCDLLCPNIPPSSCAAALTDFVRCICMPIPGTPNLVTVNN